jgi:hypothetical protein
MNFKFPVCSFGTSGEGKQNYLAEILIALRQSAGFLRSKSRSHSNFLHKFICMKGPII